MVRPRVKYFWRKIAIISAGTIARMEIAEIWP
jgi:hypothetical protein